MVEATTYLDMLVGPYRLALRTGCVLAVAQDLELTDPPTPVLQLGDDPGLVRGGRVAYLVTVETPSGPVAVVADQVGYLTGAAATRLAIPRFGILRPDLFEGAVRDREELLLLLAPEALHRLAAEFLKII